MKMSPQLKTPRLRGALCQVRSLATLFLASLSVMGLMRFLAASSDWNWLPRNRSDAAIEHFLMLHDQVPLVAEWLHRRVWVIVVGFLWPTFVYLLADTRSPTRLLLQPYILLSGIHLAGWVTAKEILGPGAVVLFELFISLVRVVQLHQLLVSPACALRYRGESALALTDPPRTEQLQLPKLDVAPAQMFHQGDMRRAIAFGIRQPWTIVGLLLVEMVLWSANALLLSWHVINVLMGLALLNTP
jgi:hypothetical protein